jgi:hypothetical protein
VKSPPVPAARLIALLLVLASVAGFARADEGSGSQRAKPSAEQVSQGTSTMRIRLTINGKAITATMLDNATSRDFLSLLPMTVTLEDYSATEKITYLPRKLSTAGAPAGSDPSVGDIAYYAPWGNLAIFYKDFGYSRGLIQLGRIVSGVEALRAPGALKVTIERVDK